MDKKVVLAVLAVVLTAGSAVGQSLSRSRCDSSEMEIYQARRAEKQNNTEAAAQGYTNAISYLESTAPSNIDLSKLVLCGEPVPKIGRRMVYYRIKLLQEQLAMSQPMISIDSLLQDLRGSYEKMAWIEKRNATWPYLTAVALAADGNYRAAFEKCRIAANCPDGEESVRQKARSLAVHIKQGALEQEKMKSEDQAAYERYVRSGAQALDFAMVSAQCSAEDARKRGDIANADMWQSRYDALKQQRSQVK